ncbi:hypothetical protein TWF730_006190 [Orbilia blumenaviensis]|uniref:DUF6697 domain-containing protein n=1 Tax=Orbilia blumenaviensis TaxID=1796055 RepID=A0AAV9TW84_9PEZI
MARISFPRDPRIRPSIPTEPLTPQEWASFDTAIGKSQGAQTPEHLRFHNPAWNLSLLRSVAQKRWEEQGGEGELEEPGPIDTSALTDGGDADMAAETDTTLEVEGSLTEIEVSNILQEGRPARKKPKLDYSGMFMPPLEDSDEDTRKRRRRDSLETDSGGNTSNRPLLGSGDTPIAASPRKYKKRGRPARKFRESPELEFEISHSSLVNETSGGTVPRGMGRTMGLDKETQRERRKLLLSAGGKVHDVTMAKLLQGARNGAPNPSPTNGLKLPREPNPETSGYKQRVSMVSTSLYSSNAQGATTTIRRRVKVKKSSLEDDSPVDEIPPSLTVPSSLVIPPPSLVPQAVNSSPTSSEYESVSSNNDFTFPAGQLRLSDLPRHVAATIPKPLEYFSRRDHVAPLIGGNLRAVVATTTPRPEAPIQTKGYIGIQPAWNPHAPRKAGQNGSMMQLSNTSTDAVSKTQKDFPLFVARGSNQWEYCGQYIVAEVARLSAFENWMHLSTAGSKLLKHWGEEILQRRFEWAKALFMQNCGWTEEKWNKATVEELMEPILGGRVPMHWVHLQCVGFDLGFYDALLRQKVKCGLAASEKIIL